MPMLLWSGKDTEIANRVCELVCEKLRIKQMFSSSRNSNGLARSERQHRVVNETLKLLVDHDTKNWDEKLPFVEHSMRNKSKDGGFSPINYGTASVCACTTRLPSRAIFLKMKNASLSPESICRNYVTVYTTCGINMKCGQSKHNAKCGLK